MTDERRYRLVITPTARRQLAQRLPEAVAFAADAFVVGPLLDNPERVGKPLHHPLADRHAPDVGPTGSTNSCARSPPSISPIGVTYTAEAVV